MRIFICTMDDPMVTNDFIKEIIEKKRKEIIGLYIPKHGHFKTKGSNFNLGYTFALFIIAGPLASFQNFLKVLKFKITGSGSIVKYAKMNGIRIYDWKSLNSKKCIREMKKIKPDVIIHQTQEILKHDFLAIPRVCTLNRHNSLLPKYRGRLAPFWAVFNGEKETGVTIHTVTEKIDAGQNILQRKIPIYKHDDYVSITKKCYKVAPGVMIGAIELLENGLPEEKKSKKKGSYYSTPTIKDALDYRKRLRKRRKS